MEKKKSILNRVYVIYLLALLVAGLVSYKIFAIQFIHGKTWKKRAETISTEMMTIDAIRGNIYAADHSFLAITIPRYEIRMDTRANGLSKKEFYNNVDSLAMALHKHFKDQSKANYKNKLITARKNGNRYLLIQDNLSYSELKTIRTFPLFRKGSNQGGIIVIQENKRLKPYGKLASRTIGRVDGVRPGVGLEMAYEQYLKGTQGLQLMEKLAGGLWRPVNPDNALEPVDGYDILTTINPNIQDVATSELAKQLKQHKADHGCVVLMEVKTGHIKAIANLTRGSDGNYYEVYNYAVGESLEPGSTFKLASMLIALESNIVKPSDSIATGKGKYEMSDGIYLHDSHHNGFGTITAQRVFEVSSNIGMAKIIRKGFRENPQEFLGKLVELGISEPLGIPIPGEGQPLIKSTTEKNWSGISLAMVAIGYESRLTPLQTLTLYNAVANGGKMIAPKFAKAILRHGKMVEKIPTRVINPKICSDKTLRQLTDMLKGVVDSGTASNLSNTVYDIAGKTGTAQIANANKGYDKSHYLASFAGFFPADNPKYSCIVVVHSPSQSGIYGNVVAGPVFRAVADKVYATAFDINQIYYSENRQGNYVPEVKNGFANNIALLYNWFNVTYQPAATRFVSNSTKNRYALAKPLAFSQNKVPNVFGMGARDAVYLLEKSGLKVLMIGKGKVIKQSIEAGIDANQYKTVTIWLK